MIWVGTKLPETMKESSSISGTQHIGAPKNLHFTMEHNQLDVNGALLQVGMFVRLQMQTGISTGTLPLGENATRLSPSEAKH